MVDYDLENLEPPILSVEEAVKRSSLFEIPPMFYPKQVGDISKGMAEADHKILSAEVLVIYMPLFFFASLFQPTPPLPRPQPKKKGLRILLSMDIKFWSISNVNMPIKKKNKRKEKSGLLTWLY